MDMRLQNLLSLARFTLLKPREGARVVLQADIPVAARWVAFALMAILSSVFAHVSFGMLPSEVQADVLAQMGNTMASPFLSVFVQIALCLFATVMIVWIGRLQGGTAVFDDVLILMAWLQFILLILQVVQIVVQIFLPPLAGLVGFASVAVFLWLLSNFIAEVQKFKSAGMVFLGVILVMFAIGLIFALVMTPVMIAGMR